MGNLTVLDGDDLVRLRRTSCVLVFAERTPRRGWRPCFPGHDLQYTLGYHGIRLGINPPIETALLELHRTSGTFTRPDIRLYPVGP